MFWPLSLGRQPESARGARNSEATATQSEAAARAPHAELRPVRSRHRKRPRHSPGGMAAPAKRARVGGGSPLAAPCSVPGDGQVSRSSPLAAGPGDSDAVSGFLRWCAAVGLELSPKVAVSRQGTVAGYGMVARESVQPGELLFAVPRAALLAPHTCSISGLLERGRAAGRGGGGRRPGRARPFTRRLP